MNYRKIGLLFLFLIVIGALVFFPSQIRKSGVDLRKLFEKLTFEKMDWRLNQARVGVQPVCGIDDEWIVLVTGIDYRGSDYLYGLSDAIRVVRIDFTKPQINIVPLPRNLVVDPPSAMDIEGKMMLNQTYFFGTSGMGHFSGEGYGAGALAAAIKETFGIAIDHYAVLNLAAFTQLIDAIGGIEVDLPTFVDDMPISYFPAGKQTLNGDQALKLARARQKYSDQFRINSQSIILNAVYDRVKDPVILLKIPSIYQTLSSSIQTDLTAADVTTLLCLVSRIKAENLLLAEPPLDLLVSEYQFIPNMSQQMMIYRWDDRFITWLNETLWSGTQPISGSGQ